MARTTNKVTLIRQRAQTLLQGINGSPNYWYTVSASNVRFGQPTGFQAEEGTLKIWISRGVSVRDPEQKTAGSPFAVIATIDLVIQAQIKAADPYLACEQMEQDVLTALRADPGFDCDAHSSLDATVQYEASEADLSQGITSAAKTIVVVTVTYKATP